MRIYCYATLCGLILCLWSPNLLAQTDEFTPSGNVYARVFSNFHESILGDDQSSAFEITQAYFGYKYKMSPDFTAEIKLDIGDQEGGEYSKLKRYAYFKKAELKYKKNGLSIRFGIISMKQFGLQEKFWEKKYVKKTYLDYYKFGSSADIGFAIGYDFLDNLHVDGLVMNGEGYKNLQSDDTYKGGVGITYKPLKDLTIRYYSDHAQQDNWQNSFTGFIGYKKKKKYAVGVEYTHQCNYGFDEGYDWQGISAYASYNITEKWEVFARYDNLESVKVGNNSQAWNAATEVGTYPRSDGDYILGGIQFMPIKKVRIAIDCQYYKPSIATDNEAMVGFLHCQYDL